MKKMIKPTSIVSWLLLFTVVYAIFATSFFMVANKQLQYKDSTSSIKSVVNNSTIGELVKGSFVEQTFFMNGDAIDGISFLIGTYNRVNQGSIIISVSEDTSNKLLFQKEFDISLFKDNAFFQVDIKEPLIDIKGKLLRIRIETSQSVDGNAITLWYNDSHYEDNQKLFVNGEFREGRLCFNVSVKTTVPFLRNYTILATSIYLFVVLYISFIVWSKKRGKIFFGYSVILAARKYRFLLTQLILRDFKTKYRRSYLGILWSVLNPLMMMIVVSSVFSYVFRFNIDRFPVYLILGQTLFNFLAESTTVAMSAVIGSASLIKKVYIPKYIFPMGKVFFSFINFLVSFVAIGIVFIIYKVPVHSTIICLPLIMVYLFFFCFGLGMILSTVTVFFRDTLHLYSVLLTAWSYLTPIFYPVDSLSSIVRYLMNFNPMYHYIQYFRNILLYGVMPTIEENLICFMFSAIFVLAGGLLYRKYQDRFILYI